MGHYDRLSALDAAFVDLETRSSALSVGAAMIFGPGPLVGPHGEVDVGALRPYVEAALARTPRYRQRLVRVPLIGQPVWVDDPDVRLDFHLRHVRVPYPGEPRQLDELLGDIFSERLDPDHPLWRLWIVEGLATGGFALVMQAHHAMTDGVGGIELIARLLAAPSMASPAPAVAAPAPRPWPRRLELLRGEIRHHNRRVAAAVRRVASAARGRASIASIAAGKTAARGVVDTVKHAVVPAPRTPLNPRHISPRRRFATVRFDLELVRRIGRACDATINDVALAIVTGALRRFLARRGVGVDRLGDLRALVPVNTRRPGEDGGNRVAMMLADLPVSEPDPARRLARVRDTTRRVKQDSGQAAGTSFAEEVADTVATGLLTSAVRVAIALRAFNVTVTNMPGPTAPLYLLGARLVALYAKVPLYERQGVGFALVSYDGGLHVGVSACWHTVPDLADLVDDLRASLAELAAPGVTGEPAAVEREMQHQASP